MSMIRGAASLPPIPPVGSWMPFSGLLNANGILIKNRLVWLLLDGGTIGNPASAGSRYASEKARELYTELWSDTTLAIYTSGGVPTARGASATADFDANKGLALPNPIGRVIVPAGTGNGLSPRTTGQTGGTETQLLLESQMPVHQHFVPMRRSIREAAGYGLTLSNIFGDRPIVYAQGYPVYEENVSDAKGGSDAHNNMQPYLVIRAHLILVGRE